MDEEKVLYETKSCFDEIQKLCISKCTIIAKYKKRRIIFFDNMIKSCAKILADFENKISGMKENKTDCYQGVAMNELQGAEQHKFLDKVCRDAYISLRLNKIIDYPYFYQKSELLAWSGGQNPYKELQSIGQQEEKDAIDLFKSTELFHAVIRILNEKNDLSEEISALKRIFADYGYYLTDEK